MVVFICAACGDTVKKNKVDQHYRSKCPACNILSCMDCGKDFAGDDYMQHTSCMSEAQKYQGHLYKASDKAAKGEAKQQAWLTKLKESQDAVDPRIRRHIDQLDGYSNIPRKKKKFINFAKNSLNMRDESILELLWSHFDALKNPSAPATPSTNAKPATGNTEPSTTTDNGEKKRKREKDDGEESEAKADKKKKKKKKSKSKEEVEDEKPKKEKKSKKKSNETETSTGDTKSSPESQDPMDQYSKPLPEKPSLTFPSTKNIDDLPSIIDELKGAQNDGTSKKKSKKSKKSKSKSKDVDTEESTKDLANADGAEKKKKKKKKLAQCDEESEAVKSKKKKTKTSDAAQTEKKKKKKKKKKSLDE